MAEVGLSGHPSPSNQIYLKMKKEDEVWITTNENYCQCVAGENWGSLSGYKFDGCHRNSNT